MSAVTRPETLDRVPTWWLDQHDLTWFFIFAQIGRDAPPEPR